MSHVIELPLSSIHPHPSYLRLYDCVVQRWNDNSKTWEDYGTIKTDADRIEALNLVRNSGTEIYGILRRYRSTEYRYVNYDRGSSDALYNGTIVYQDDCTCICFERILGDKAEFSLFCLNPINPRQVVSYAPFSYCLEQSKFWQF